MRYYAVLSSTTFAESPKLHTTADAAMRAFREYLKVSLGWSHSELTDEELFELWTSKFGGHIALCAFEVPVPSVEHLQGKLDALRVANIGNSAKAYNRAITDVTEIIQHSWNKTD